MRRSLISNARTLLEKHKGRRNEFIFYRWVINCGRPRVGKSGFRTSARSFENKDYYKILGLQRTSTKADIKKKYFELVLEHIS